MASCLHKKPIFTKHDQYYSRTFFDQQGVETRIKNYFLLFSENDNFHQKIKLSRNLHKKYLLNSLKGLSESNQALDASIPWLIYWTLHSLDILGVLDSEEFAKEFIQKGFIKKAISTLSWCQSKEGGFGGGHLQLPHLAPTYAATNALAILSRFDPTAISVIDRKTMKEFLLKMKNKDGSFNLHENGESDTRGAYCALSTAHLLQIDDQDVTKNTGGWIATCQTYEGGFSARPWREAHGGYTFCAIAALSILGELDKIEMEPLIDWLVHKQMRFSGGFQGRINKLVDGCYSFWQGGVFSFFKDYLNEQTNQDIFKIYQIGQQQKNENEEKKEILKKEEGEKKEKEKEEKEIIGEEKEEEEKEEEEEEEENEPLDWLEGNYGSVNLLFDEISLQGYILACCQDTRGGLMDKPLKGRDLYHTCYCLSGLSCSQNNLSKEKNPVVLGLEENLVNKIDPIHNITELASNSVKKYFKNLNNKN
ncbi:protein farnesyltransferase subunit beta [Anaeramoeba flamelloides]|uniref:Protein farnesyltransferase subunit beta n=1 Tax=Anaeramoeba flamelloides TaxID=1746091 RepID=A0AAV7ZXK5_9EUKA|nr:protein farnesyltransferase subunit beta [Anaeramoeba flamelloides]